MPFRQFEYFLEVASCQSINQAAQNLYMSPQALRASIGALETKLGFQLFYRSPRGMELTREGSAILEDARELMRMSERWKERYSGEGRYTGTVQVVSSTSACSAVTQVILLCRQKYPELIIQLFESRDDALLALLQHKRILGVVGAAPSSALSEKYMAFAQAENYRLELLQEDCFCVYINSAHPCAAGDTLSLGRLRDFTMAMYPREDTRMEYRGIYKYFSPSPPLYIAHQEEIFKVISENQDIAALFPRLVGLCSHFVQEGRVKCMMIPEYPMPAQGCIMFPQGRKLLPPEKLVAALIREVMMGYT